ncbi:MAG TPA: AAA domain-containing protein [Thermomicrobiales bacterium]|nr:AAA domain-containing protein [Thermomicrobiales bacterium]
MTEQIAPSANTADFPVLPEAGGWQLSPTDIAQFIRLEQCERYLRLRLHARTANRHFMRDYGVVPQAIPALLTRSGADFEARVEAAVRRRFAALNFATETARGKTWTADNARVLAALRALAPGATLVLFQPRLEALVEGWRLRGDVDILRAERDAVGALHLLIADMKSSTAAKVEHRLQVAFYHAMLARLLADDLSAADIALGILYRGPSAQPGVVPPEELARREQERADAARLFNVPDAYLELLAEPERYLDAVRDLVTGPDSTARRVARADFNAIPFHLTYKCDGCLFNEFCLKRAAERDSLSLIPTLTLQDKRALQRAGITTTRQLAALKEFTADDDTELAPAPGQEALARRLAATWPVGPRLDELVQRAKRYRRYCNDPVRALHYIPHQGYGSLPYADAEHNPNLVRVYLDAQHDYLHDRVYLAGALVVACEAGVEARSRTVVELAQGPPDTAEREEGLLLRWLAQTIAAIVELAAPDERGEPCAPIHLIFWNAFAQRILLDALARHFETVLAATPLYDFVTQLASYDSPVASFLDQEIRGQKNYPMVGQSLYAVAAYTGFDWNAPEPYRQLFRARVFDARGRLRPGDGQSPWITRRARFNSQLPLEYAYAAWRDLAGPGEGDTGEHRSFRNATPALLKGFQARRLAALAHIADQFHGNDQTTKTAFRLPNLATWQQRAGTLADALDEFVTIERHAALAAWKGAHLADPERRVLAGNTLIVRYLADDQEPGVTATVRDYVRRQELYDEYAADYRAAHPNAAKVQLTKDQRTATQWTPEGLRVWLRLDCADVDCGLDEALALTTLRRGDTVVLAPRWETDSRLPAAEQTVFTPTPKQLLYRPRGVLEELAVERDDAGRAVTARALVALQEGRGGPWSNGFAFRAIDRPPEAGTQYTLDADPNDWPGYWCSRVTAGLRAGGPNTLYDRLRDLTGAQVAWPDTTAAGQARFLAGLDALHEADGLHGFEPSKRDYIGAHGEAPVLLVQGPPGTGKSYATAFAIFARLQGALAADRVYRVVVSCKTHAATDVLLANVAAVQARLRAFHAEQPALWARYFDDRLLDVPLFRLRPRQELTGVMPLYKRDDRHKTPGQPLMADALLAARWCVAGATPGGVYSAISERWGTKSLFGHLFCDCLVLDEASQLNLPEALMAALPLRPDGQTIVVGDHRQMPPIIKHDWAHEHRRTFKEFRAFESLFRWLLRLDPPTIKFAESFRLHATLAEFLRQEIYRHDGIDYHSNRHAVLPALPHADPFVAAALAPDHPLVVVVHDEDASQVRNPFERDLIAPVLAALADTASYALGPADGLGVVVPHRAQRADIQERVPALTVRDPDSGAVVRSAVDTVERFQGDEREVIVVSATESDRDYLLTTGEFLLDPRRLTVALSRAKKKLILVAARSIFTLFSADEETFANAQLWKDLLCYTCTVSLWRGERDGQQVEVWGDAGTAGTPRSRQERQEGVDLEKLSPPAT